MMLRTWTWAISLQNVMSCILHGRQCSPRYSVYNVATDHVHVCIRRQWWTGYRWCQKITYAEHTTYKDHQIHSLVKQWGTYLKSIPRTSRKIWGSSCESLFNRIQVNHETPISTPKRKYICSSSYTDFMKHKIKSKQKMRESI